MRVTQTVADAVTSLLLGLDVIRPASRTPGDRAKRPSRRRSLAIPMTSEEMTPMAEPSLAFGADGLLPVECRVPRAEDLAVQGPAC